MLQSQTSSRSPSSTMSQFANPSPNCPRTLPRGGALALRKPAPRREIAPATRFRQFARRSPRRRREMIGELGAGLPEAQTHIDRDRIPIAVLGREAERRMSHRRSGRARPPSSRRPWPSSPMGRCYGEKIGDRGVPATIRPRRKPTGDPLLLSRATKHRSAPPARPLRTQASFCRSAISLGMKGSAWRRSRAKALRAMAVAAGKVGGRRQIDSRHGNSPSGEVAGHGDQAFDPPEARGFQREGTVRLSRGNATGADRNSPRRPSSRTRSESASPRPSPPPRIFRR